MATRTAFFTWLLLCGCAGDQATEQQAAPGLAQVLSTSHRPQLQLLDFDITQHTCALYVALRSRALNESISFGRDLAGVELHWNFCPGGKMLACSTAPGANGTPVQMGIPWPYPAPGTH